MSGLGAESGVLHTSDHAPEHSGIPLLPYWTAITPPGSWTHPPTDNALLLRLILSLLMTNLPNVYLLHATSSNDGFPSSSMTHEPLFGFTHAEESIAGVDRAPL